jgi:hypothetical protein
MLVKLGQKIPTKPADDSSWKQGARVMLKLHADCGGDVREIASNAAAFLKGLDELHTKYESERGAHNGKLPVVVMTSSNPITTGQGQKRSTNYQPVFTIVNWVPRPADLVWMPKSGHAPATAAHTNGATPPSTGATVVAAPTAPALAIDDFG